MWRGGEADARGLGMKRSNLGLLLLGIGVGAGAGLLLAPEAPQRWKRKAKAGVSRGRETVALLREATEILQEFRQLGRPLDAED